MMQPTSRPKHSRAVFNLLVVAAMLVALLAACAPAAPAGEGDAAAPAADAQTTITVWGWPAADVAYQSFIADFEAANPDIKVDIQMMPTAEEHDKLLASLAAGAGAPDVAMIEINYIDKFVAKGGLVDLLTEPFNAAQYEKDMVPYKWAQASSPDGRLVAFPWDIGPATFFYRRDLFEQAGLASDPESVAAMVSTWPGFLDVAKQLTNADEQRWAMGNASDIVYTNFAHRNLFDADWNCAVNNELAVQLLTYAQEARNAGVDAKVSNWSAEWQTMLGNDSIAMQYGGAWFGGFLKGWLKPEGVDWEGKWGIFEVPEDPVRTGAAPSWRSRSRARTRKPPGSSSSLRWPTPTRRTRCLPRWTISRLTSRPSTTRCTRKLTPSLAGRRRVKCGWTLPPTRFSPSSPRQWTPRPSKSSCPTSTKRWIRTSIRSTTLDEACIEIEQQTAPDKEEALKLRQ
jgi:multiple sugar transport system substrate-binding protein